MVSNSIVRRVVLKPLSNYSFSSISASYGAFARILRNVDYNKRPQPHFGLFIINLRLLISPVLLCAVSASFGAGALRVPSLVFSIMSQFCTFDRSGERYITHDERGNMDEIHSMVDALITTLKLDSTNLHNDGSVGHLFTNHGSHLQITSLIKVLEGYKSSQDPQCLVRRILISLSEMNSIDELGVSKDISRLIGMVCETSDSAAYGVRHFVPMEDDFVAYTGEESNFYLSLVQLFVEKQTVEYYGRERSDVLIPSHGQLVAYVFPASLEHWVHQLLTAFESPTPIVPLESVAESRSLKRTVHRPNAPYNGPPPLLDKLGGNRRYSSTAGTKKHRDYNVLLGEWLAKFPRFENT